MDPGIEHAIPNGIQDQLQILDHRIAISNTHDNLKEVADDLVYISSFKDC